MKELHDFEMSLNICQLKLLKVSEGLHLHHHYSKNKKSLYFITVDRVLLIHT